MSQQRAFIEHIEGQDLFLRGAPRLPNGVLLTRSETTSATLKVYDLTSSTPDTAVETVTLDVGANPPGATYN